MATVAQLKERVAPLNPPGSEVQQALACQTGTNFVIFVMRTGRCGAHARR